MTQDKNILIRNIYYMLAYAFRDFRFNMYKKINGENFEDIHNLFAEILIRSVSCQLKQGLYKTYVNQEGALPVIRGKIDMLKTRAVQQNNPYHVYCNYDELTVNNPYNQVVKTTLQHLVKCPDVDESRKRAIRQILRCFASVDSTDLKSTRFDQFCFDRNNQNYQMLINICRLIFENRIMTTEKGNYKLYTLSDDQMARLFEKFVLAYYRREHPETKPRVSHINWDIIEEESTIGILPVMQTDIMLTIGDRTLIIDTKYYGESLNVHFDKNKIHVDHLRQIYTYVMEYDKDRTGLVDGMLLYAKTQEDVVPNGQMKKPVGNTIYFRTLDLNQNFEEIAKQLEAIIQVGKMSNVIR